MNLQSGKPTTTVTSFRKKAANTINIRGTRISPQNAQLLTSTGSSTLDFFLGGGLAIGTIFLVEEDHFGNYSEILLKYFLSEGYANQHKLFLSSGERPSQTILKQLPSVKVPEVKSEKALNETVTAENLKIAWRYQGQSSSKEISSIRLDSQNHGYDLSKSIPEEDLKKCSIVCYDPQEIVEDNSCSSDFVAFPYMNFLQRLQTELISFRTTLKTCDNIVRIGMFSLGSPLWNLARDESGLYLLRFLYLLKSLLRTSFGVAFVTMPSYLFKNKAIRSRIHQMCDTVIRLESFVGSEKKSNPLFKEYDGLLHILKLPVLNTCVYPTRTADLTFKLKKRDFIIERLHLPPDFEEAPTESTYGCGGQPSKLDF